MQCIQRESPDTGPPATDLNRNVTEGQSTGRPASRPQLWEYVVVSWLAVLFRAVDSMLGGIQDMFRERQTVSMVYMVVFPVLPSPM